MRYLIDILALVSAGLIGSGTYLEYGLGYALIVFGAIMLKLVLISAYLENLNVPDETTDSEPHEGA